MLAKKYFRVLSISSILFCIIFSYQNCGQMEPSAFPTSEEEAISKIDFTVNAMSKAGRPMSKGRILVKFKEQVSKAEIKDLLDGFKVKVKEKVADDSERHTLYVIGVADGQEEAVAEILSAQENVEYAEVDHLLRAEAFSPNDPGFLTSWHHGAIGSSQAWDVSRGEGVVVAVIDSGVAAVSDMQGQVLPGWHVISNAADSSFNTNHGTAVASVIAGKINNGVGVAGLAPSAKILPIRITNDSSGWAYSSDIAKAIYYAADNGARVANISYGVANSAVVRTAANYMRVTKGGLVVACAMNDGRDPGTIPSDDILFVSATDRGGILASFSNFGQFIDISAPGVDVQCLYPDGKVYKCWGTSFSAPIVSAAAALLWAKAPQMTNVEVEQILRETASDLGAAGLDPQFGSGQIHVGNALSRFAPAPSAEPVDNPPTIFLNGYVDGSSVIANRPNPMTFEASDDNKVVKVALYVNGSLRASKTAPPWTFNPSMNVTGATNSVTVMGVAYDSKGQTGSVSVKLVIKR